MVSDLLERIKNHDRLALSRLLTLISRNQNLEAIDSSAQLGASSDPAVVCAITGSAGVGKSTLVGKLIEELRQRGKSVAVLACDPESSLTGGALLGDRVRMPSRPGDPDVMIRSLAVPSGQQAIAGHLDLMVRSLTAFGFDMILLETVGAGQGDTAVRDVADVVVVLVQPEAGDELQWEKAGLLEVADVVVVHKSDLPGAERVESQLRELLNLPGCRRVPVLRASAAKGEGLSELVDAIEALECPDDPDLHPL